MPDATARSEPYGAYFCDNGGSGHAYLGQVIASLVSEFGAVQIEELEPQEQRNVGPHQPTPGSTERSVEQARKPPFEEYT